MTDLGLLEDFIPEAIEHLEDMEANLLRLEENPDDARTLGNIFRSAHTIKGSAEYMGMKRIATIAHRLENLLDLIRQGERRPDTTILDTLIESRDRISDLVEDLRSHQEERAPIDDLVEKIDGITRLYTEGPEPEAPPAAEPGDGDVLGLGEELEALDPETDLAGEADAFQKDESGDLADEISASLDGELGDALADEPAVPEAPPAAAAQSPAPPVPGGPAEDIFQRALGTLVPEESYEEDYDDELFQIFMEHTRENLKLLQDLAGSPGALENPSDSLDRFSEWVENLRSSASYMDYRRLATFYGEWSAQLSEVRERHNAGSPVGFVFVNSYVNQVIESFGGDKDLGVSPVALSSPEPTPASPADEHAPAFASEPPSEEVLEPPAEEDVLEPAPAAVEATPVQEDTTQGLFDELDSVFDTTTAPEQEAEAVDDPFADDMEDVLVAAGAPSQDKKAASPPQAQAPAAKTREAAKTPDSAPSPHPQKTSAKAPTALPPEKVAESVERSPDLPQPATPAAPLAPPVSTPEAPAAAGMGEAQEAAPVGPVKAEGPAPEAKAAAEPKAKAVSEPKAKAAPEAEPAPVGEVKYGDDRGTERLVKQSLRVDAAKIDTLMNEVGELVVSRASYAQLYNDMREFQQRLSRVGVDAREMKVVRDLTFRLSEATVALGRVANDLQEGVMKIRMLPIAQLFNRYPRLVRDLVHNTGKKVHLEVKGEETELDKMVIEEIADPLVHIIRNAVDHGVEVPEERKTLGKPEIATVCLESYHESNHVVVEITDDGKGIDPEEVSRSALKKGLVTREELDRMRGREVISLIMMPGFSTSDTVTTTSGRGVGMDVVKKNVEKLNGTVEVDSKPGEGTRVRIKIPLTLAIIQALLVRVGDEIFTIPLSVVEETLRIKEKDVSTIEGVEVVQYREGVLSLMRLSQEFKADSSSPDPNQCYVVVVNTGMRQVGLVVDSLIGQEETVIKPLVDYLQERSGFSGATILGDGRVSLILDVYELVALCMQRLAKRRIADDPGNALFATEKLINLSDVSTKTIH